jgi:hypothetical protein
MLHLGGGRRDLGSRATLSALLIWLWVLVLSYIICCYDDNYHTVIFIVVSHVTYEVSISLTIILQKETHLTSELMFLNL